MAQAYFVFVIVLVFTLAVDVVLDQRSFLSYSLGVFEMVSQVFHGRRTESAPRTVYSFDPI